MLTLSGGLETSDTAINLMGSSDVITLRHSYVCQEHRRGDKYGSPNLFEGSGRAEVFDFNASFASGITSGCSPCL
jgi:hypothetical protein